jgi:hypothetical protein
VAGHCAAYASRDVARSFQFGRASAPMVPHFVLGGFGFDRSKKSAGTLSEISATSQGRLGLPQGPNHRYWSPLPPPQEMRPQTNQLPLYN